jgi:hypothetical protein
MRSNEREMKMDKWGQLKVILEGAIEAHKVSGNNDRLTEIEFVLREMQNLEERENQPPSPKGLVEYKRSVKELDER